MEKKEQLKAWAKRYCIDGLNGMVQGLFCTLIVGLILKQMGTLIGGYVPLIGNYFVMAGVLATLCTGVAIGIGTAHALNVPKMVIFAAGAVGLIGANASALRAGTFLVDGAITLTGPGDPFGAFLAAVAGAIVGEKVSGRTKVDIIITPGVTILAGGIVGLLIGPPISAVMLGIGELIRVVTEAQPILMGIVVSVVVGMALASPISSAALAIMLGLTGLPAGAATIGCATQMVGFGVASFRENGWNGLFAQGLGTAKLQLPNIVRRPIIWVPPIVASAILGPIGIMLFNMQSNQFGAGMGTSGLVGQLMTWEVMSPTTEPISLLIRILLLHFILPGILTLIVSEFMRKKGWIKFGDMKLPE